MTYYYSYDSNETIAYSSDGEYFYSPEGGTIGYLHNDHLYSQAGDVIGYFSSDRKTLYSQDGQPLWYKG